ncbi:stage VI sporulation protein D [Cytobacillus sp. FJAT-54145]|uniref:Stage VI sporulation protein D n=1 Tax=Cytobacillus spartinae TaxID=3299023 RepID=A0ABW6KKQ7_9BACI
MSQGNESCLRFSLEESVWFQKGQEVEELISISLDPNITINENEQYVTIKGSLLLTGEYKRNENDLVGEEEWQSAPKFLQAIEEREEGVYEFSHNFPVDITIPNNRIQNLEEIDVEVETFDYVFQERSCMKLTADLTIKGLYGEQQHVEVEEEAEEIELELEPLYRSSAAVVEFENEVEEEEKVEQPPAAQAEDLYTPFEAEARKEPVEEIEEKVEEEAVVNQWENDGAPQVQANEAQEYTAPEISFSAQRKETSPAPAYNGDNNYGETEEAEYEEYMESPVLEEESSSSSSEQPAKKKKLSKKKSLSLTEFFARKEEAEELTKLKVCIVQQGDTLDLLAERYDIHVQQLLKVNHLEVNQDVYEGQVLYIPVVVIQK